MNLNDFIYVDLSKVISLYSQLTGGVVEALERNSERSSSSDNKRSYDFRVFRHDAGGTDIDRHASRETVKPHHALLKELEAILEQEGYMADLTALGLPSLRDAAFRSQLKKTFCVKVTGRAVIEDYARIKGIAEAFPEVVQLVNKSIESKILKSDNYREVQDQISAREIALKQIKDRNKRSEAESQLREAKRKLVELVADASRLKGVEQWILEGVSTWIDTFLPGIVNLRVYPVTERPDEHVFGHLKKDCFEDVSTNSFHFTYGSFPTEELTLIGIITSVPNEEGEQFKPLKEFERPDLGNSESVEQAFRGVFRGSDGMEQMIRTCRFPRVLVHPLVVYRSVAPNMTVRGTE
jgi:hypothetical protein